jgi:hypothetical protein
LFLVVLPIVGFAFGIWLMFTPTSSEAAAAAAYKNAPMCSSSVTEQGCIQIAQAQLVSYSTFWGKCGGHTDRLTLKVADGNHEAEIAFDCLAANPAYALPDGTVKVRVYRGLITTVYDANGKAYETQDSPSGGRSWRRGIAAVILIVFGAWLLVLAIVAIPVNIKRIQPRAV